MIAGRRFNGNLLSDRHNYKLDVQLILDLHSATPYADWINAEIGLFDCRTARVGSFCTMHLRQNWSALTMQRQFTGDKPMVGSGLFDLRRMKADERIAFTL